MTSRDWLDEQMDEADLRHDAEELRHDEIEAQLRDQEDECADCGKSFDVDDLYPMRDGSVICETCRVTAEMIGGKL